MVSLFDKANIINGIEGQLRHLDLYDYLHSGKFNMPINSISDFSKLKNKIKTDLTPRLAGLTTRADVNWLALVMEPALVASLGKLPVQSLKYLEGDLVLALTNWCANTLVPGTHLCILPYNTALNRFIILYLFIYYNLNEIKIRLRTHYNSNITNTMIANMETAKAAKTLKNVAVSDSSMKDTYMKYLTELGMKENNTELHKLLNSLCNKTTDTNIKGFFAELTNYKYSGINFVSCGVVNGSNNVSRYLIGIICGGYNNTQRRGAETPYTEWNLWNETFYFSFTCVNNAFVGFSNDDIYAKDDDYFVNLSDSRRIATYGSVKASFEAHKTDIKSGAQYIINHFGLKTILKPADYSKFIECIITAKKL